MAHVQKGLTVRAPEWWKHLRPYVKRRFWKRQRKDNQRIIQEQRK